MQGITPFIYPGVLGQYAMSTSETTQRTNTSTGDEMPEIITEPTHEERDLSKDDVFHVLQNERRRLVLEYLDGEDGPVKMRDVAEQVAAWEHDTTVQALHSDQRQRVYIALYQSHLPKLDDLGIIEYNQPRGVVEPTEITDEIAGYLDNETEEVNDEQTDKDTLPWLGSYLGASTIGVGLTGGAWTGILSLSGLWLATLMTTMFAVLTVGLAVLARR